MVKETGPDERGLRRADKGRSLRLHLAAVLFFSFVASVGITIGSLNYPLPPVLATTTHGAAEIIKPLDHSRILVVAPHPDDETLAAGALIRQQTAAGGEIRVVILTNGDAFRLAGERTLEKVRLSSKDFMAFGELRHEEARQALRRLGVKPRDIVFLGYPDRGLARLWSDNWQRPYRSPYTHTSTVPYAFSFQPGAPYTGEALLSQLRHIIEEYKPEAVVAPSLSDLHPDHHATALFVRFALQGSAVKTLYEYTIHREEWRLQTANKTLAKMDRWLTGEDSNPRLAMVDVSPELARAKGEAIAAYKSQVRIMPRFMESYKNRPEFFLRINLGEPMCCATIKRTAKNAFKEPGGHL